MKLELIYHHLISGILLCMSPLMFYGQEFDPTEIERDVLSSTGQVALTLSNGYSFPYTVGETNVAGYFDNGEDDDIDYAVGFQQPEIVVLPPLEAMSRSTVSQCPGYKDGTILVSYQGCVGPFTISLIGNDVDTTVEELFEDDVFLFENLDSGNYVVTLRGDNFCTFRDTQRVDLKNPTCDVVKYTGITPNGDGRNDIWIIDNVEINPNNTVTLYNRWGVKVWSAANYDNVNVVWEGKSDNGQDLPAGTYFYTLEVNGNSAANGSGWIQLTR